MPQGICKQCAGRGYLNSESYLSCSLPRLSIESIACPKNLPDSCHGSPTKRMLHCTTSFSKSGAVLALGIRVDAMQIRLKLSPSLGTDSCGQSQAQSCRRHLELAVLSTSRQRFQQHQSSWLQQTSAIALASLHI